MAYLKIRHGSMSDPQRYRLVHDAALQASLLHCNIEIIIVLLTLSLFIETVHMLSRNLLAVATIIVLLSKEKIKLSFTTIGVIHNSEFN